MAKCPYDKSIECDTKYRNKEKLRQMQIALRGGGFWIGPSHTDCGAHSWQCARLMPLQKQR